MILYNLIHRQRRTMFCSDVGRLIPQFLPNNGTLCQKHMLITNVAEGLAIDQLLKPRWGRPAAEIAILKKDPDLFRFIFSKIRNKKVIFWSHTINIAIVACPQSYFDIVEAGVQPSIENVRPAIESKQYDILQDLMQIDLSWRDSFYLITWAIRNRYMEAVRLMIDSKRLNLTTFMAGLLLKDAAKRKDHEAFDILLQGCSFSPEIIRDASYDLKN